MMVLISDLLQRKNKQHIDSFSHSELVRLVEFGRVSASLIHEMSSPLTAASLVLDQMEGESNERDLSQVRRNLRILERYLVAARQQLRGESKAVSFSLTIAIHQVAMILSAQAKANHVRLLINTIGSIRLYGDQVKFHQILANVINNAIEAYDHSMASSRLVNVRVDLNDRSEVVISVSDHGVGISHKQLKRIFQPFYSTKLKDGRGLGIGLDITRNYIERDFGGTITAISSLEEGTTFRINIPLPKNLS